MFLIVQGSQKSGYDICSYLVFFFPTPLVFSLYLFYHLSLDSFILVCGVISRLSIWFHLSVYLFLCISTVWCYSTFALYLKSWVWDLQLCSLQEFFSLWRVFCVPKQLLYYLWPFLKKKISTQYFDRDYIESMGTCR